MSLGSDLLSRMLDITSAQEGVLAVIFKIAKDGRLLSCRVNKSSGLPSADQAALKAVELTAPFRPLPADFKGASIDIQFTFDYNVFNASRY